MTRIPAQDCYIALELSRAKWLVGALLPGRAKVITALSTYRTRPREAAHEPMSGTDAGRVPPCLERLGSEEAVDASRDKMTRNGEVVVGGCM